MNKLIEELHRNINILREYDRKILQYLSQESEQSMEKMQVPLFFLFLLILIITIFKIDDIVKWVINDNIQQQKIEWWEHQEQIEEPRQQLKEQDLCPDILPPWGNDERERIIFDCYSND